MTKLQIPNYHRQRFLLVLLAQSGGILSKMDFQKLLFLSQQNVETPHYDFVPYFFGCYSFQAQSDIELLESRGWLRTVGHDIQLLEKSTVGISREARARVGEFVRNHEEYRGKKLVRYVYERYPYYAIHSKMAKDILNEKSLEAVGLAEKKLKSNAKQLFTIGYEGLSFEKYVNELISHDVRVLCDVRNNPLSRKFGFSKGMLSSVLPKLGIEYVHIPDLGIASQSRGGLETKSDYIELFKTYRKTLPQKTESLNTVNGLFDQNRRIALTCFEKHHDYCHRHCVSEYIEDTRAIRAVHL